MLRGAPELFLNKGFWFHFGACARTGQSQRSHVEDIKGTAEIFLKLLTGMGRMADAYHWLQNPWGENVRVKTYNKGDTKRWASANKYWIDHRYGNLGDLPILGQTHTRVEAD
jgi:hypothetical protein